MLVPLAFQEIAAKHTSDMHVCMRTTFDLPDQLLDRARRVAQEAGSSMRDLVIEGLTEVIARRSRLKDQPYRLQDCAVQGEGLQPGVTDLRAEGIRDLIHDEAARFRP